MHYLWDSKGLRQCVPRCAKPRINSIPNMSCLILNQKFYLRSWWCTIQTISTQTINSTYCWVRFKNRRRDHFPKRTNTALSFYVFIETQWVLNFFRTQNREYRGRHGFCMKHRTQDNINSRYGNLDSLKYIIDVVFNLKSVTLKKKKNY